ncbi:DUF2510 domain-containing protein [Streptomyces sp. NPDC102467]|uniref:DUF2510 domain-containing protein n=1 Tax=Streptomyces sp. NPDC102467 TaxID=3366179 RepID=UPI0038095370
MSMQPPPGWYPDPRAPATERWWDGAAWTQAHRPAPVALARPPRKPGAGRGKAVAVAATGIVLVAAIVAGVVVVVSGDGGAGGTEARNGPTGSAPASAPPTTSAAPSPTEDATRVTDQLNGITLPVVDGWQKAENVADDDVLLTTPRTYTCPYDDGLCRHGTVATRTVTGVAAGASARALATKDVSDAADLAYDTDAIGQRPFGGMTGHKVVAERQIAVAGRAGFLVRWKVTTAEGPGGYVQSVVFPSSVGSQSLVAVRCTLDASDASPPLADLDTIVKGIRPVGATGGGGGVGSSVGPTN